MKIRVTMEVDLKPFEVPNFVQENIEEQGARTFPLSHLTAEALDVLCGQFRQDVFEKAGKLDPN